MRLVRVLLVGLCCAVLMIAVTAVVHAQDPTPDPDSNECIGCHEGLRTYWDHSSHAQAFENPEFAEAWAEQGEPRECLTCHTTGYDPATGTYMTEGVDCLACHSPVTENHPDQYMPTDVSSRLCGTCHVDTFGEWESSHHAQEDMACGQCHNPHTAELRVDNAQVLCHTCHEDEAHNYSFTGHASEGLLCTDCHMTVAETADSDGHAIRKHTFEVDLDTCNRCHEQDMHSAIEQQVNDGSKELVSCTRVDVARVSATPEQPLFDEPQEQTSPLVYFIPAGVGLVFGVIVAPWTESVLRRRKEDK